MFIRMHTNDHSGVQRAELFDVEYVMICRVSKVLKLSSKSFSRTTRHLMLSFIAQHIGIWTPSPLNMEKAWKNLKLQPNQLPGRAGIMHFSWTSSHHAFWPQGSSSCSELRRRKVMVVDLSYSSAVLRVSTIISSFHRTRRAKPQWTTWCVFLVRNLQTFIVSTPISRIKLSINICSSRQCDFSWPRAFQ